MSPLIIIKNLHIVKDIIHSILSGFKINIISTLQRRSSKPRESHPQLLTEPYVNLSIHTALVIQPPNSTHASEQITMGFVYTIPAAIDPNVVYDVVDV